MAVGKRFMALSITGGALLLSLACGNPASADQWDLVYSDEFKGNTLSSDWTIRKTNKHLYNDNLGFNEDAVSIVNNDYLQFRTRRHCVDNINEVMNDSNASVAPCPAGKMTRYSSGRVMSSSMVDGSKPFRAEIRAKVNWNGLKGTRPSLWMRNSVDLQKCHTDVNASDPYGELDILEWYSSTPDITWSAAHISCFHSNVNNTWRTRNFGHRLGHRVNKKPASLANEWHVWAVEYDGEKVRFFVDDELVVVYQYRASDSVYQQTLDMNKVDENGRIPSTMPDEDFSKLGIDRALIDKVFGDKWFFILNDYVESPTYTNPPNPDIDFPTQTFHIDYVRLFQRGTAANNNNNNAGTGNNANTGNNNANAGTGNNNANAGVGGVNANAQSGVSLRSPGVAGVSAVSTGLSDASASIIGAPNTGTETASQTSHRLLSAVIGAISAIILAVWLWRKKKSNA